MNAREEFGITNSPLRFERFFSATFSVYSHMVEVEHTRDTFRVKDANMVVLANGDELTNPRSLLENEYFHLCSIFISLMGTILTC